MLDFAQIKQSFPIQDAIPFLGLIVKQYNGSYRGRCPACNGGNDRSLVITPDKNAYFCFVAQRGGDVIALVSHILKIGMREAAQKIADYIGTVPQDPARKENSVVSMTASNVPTASFQPLSYLLYEHEHIQRLGFSPEAAERLGIGFANKGMMRGRICYPLFDHTEIVGYVGIAPGADVKLPNNLKSGGGATCPSTI